MSSPRPALAEHLIDQQVADPERLQALRTSGLLDPLPDEAFDRLTRLAALAVSAPIAAFTLVDADRDVYKAAHGLPPPLDTGRELRGRTFCQHVVSGAQALVLEDTRQWPGYRDVPTVQSLGVRAYLGVPITDAAGLCLGALCALDIRPHPWTDRDIEMMEELARSLARELALRTAARDAQAAVSQKSAFLAAMCHEIRSPLNAICATAERLSAEPLAGAAQDQVNRIGIAGRHLSGLVNALLDLSRLEAGGMPFETVPLSLEVLATEVVALVHEAAQAKGLSVRVERSPGTAWCLGDPTRLRQAVLNLMGNAVKFTRSGEVTLRIERDPEQPGQVRFMVRDSGIGLTAPQLASLFQPYAQAEASTGRLFGGTGLGLHLVQELATRMGGRCGASSEPDVGSLFWFTARLPPCEAPQPATGSGATALELLRRHVSAGRVLLVEDNVLSQEVVSELLGIAGLAVEVATDGQQALKRLTQAPSPSLVLMDLHLPDMNGYAVTRQIHLLPGLSDLPVVMLTGDAWDTERERCLQAGAVGWLSKPIAAEALWATVLRWWPPTPAA